MTEPMGDQDRGTADARPSVVVVLAGGLDASRADRVRETVMDAINGHPGRVVEVDLSGVEFADSSVLAVFLGGLRAAATNGGALRLRNPSPRFAKVLATTGLDKVFDVG